MRLVAAAVLCLAAGCASPGSIKGYEGPELGDDALAIVETTFRSEAFGITDNVITTIDGVRYERGGYVARVLPGQRWVGVQGTLRAAGQPRVQHCAFDLNADPGCTYRPAVPSYPRPQLPQPAGADWRLSRPMTMVVECGDTTYAFQVPVECSAKPLCRSGTGFGNCP